MTKELLEAYESLNTDIQTFQNEYAKAMVVVQIAGKNLKETKEQIEKSKKTLEQEEAEFDAHKQTIIDSAIQEYIEQSEGGDAEGYGPAENKNGG